MNRLFSLLLCLFVLQLATALGEEGTDFQIGVQFTHGKVGPVNESSEFLQGEPLMVSIKVHGAALDNEGLVHCWFNVSLLDADKKVAHSYPAMEWNATASIPGKPILLPASVPIENEMKAGKYFLQISASDANSEKMTKAVIPFQIVPADQMKIGTIQLSRDRAGAVFAGKCYNVGEAFIAHFRIQNPNKSGNKWKMQFGTKLLNHQKQVINDQFPPQVIETFAPQGGQVAGSVGGYNLNVPGSYYMQIVVEDLETKQKTERLIPFVVIDPEARSEEAVSSKPVKRVGR